MRRVAILLCLLMMMPLVGASPDPTVDVTLERRLSNFDIGINGGAMSPNGQTVLIFGEEGYAHIISAEHADDDAYDIRLENETTNNLNSVSWHPAGKSALIVGDAGTVLRYNSTNYALGEAEGSSVMSTKNISAIQFTAASSVAYLGTDDGQIWKYIADTFVMIDHVATTPIFDIACMKNDNICVVATANNGIGIIDQSDRVSWISNTRWNTWIGVSCDDPTMPSCTGFASGKKTAAIHIDTMDTSQSTLGEIIGFGGLYGDYLGDHPATGSSTIIALGPLGLVRWNQYEEEAFLMFSNDNVSDEDILLSGDRYAMAWENSENTGFLVTGQGRIVSFVPASESDSGDVPAFLLVLVALCVPGVFIGLIYWNSPWLQRKYAKLVGRGKKVE